MSRLSVSRRRMAVVLVGALTLVTGCSDGESDDLSPIEPEVGERDTEIVPGEGGPVD